MLSASASSSKSVQRSLDAQFDHASSSQPSVHQPTQLSATQPLPSSQSVVVLQEGKDVEGPSDDSSDVDMDDVKRSRGEENQSINKIYIAENIVSIG